MADWFDSNPDVWRQASGLTTATGAAPQPLSGGDPSGEITALYQQRLGRAPNAQELASEIENAGKYGLNQLNTNLQERAASNGGGQSGPLNGNASASAPGVQSIQPFNEKFTAPTREQASAEPGFQFSLGEGLQVLRNRSSAAGSYRNPATDKALEAYATSEADKNYTGVYNRAANEFDRRFNIANTNETNRFTSQSANRLYDRSVLTDDRNFAANQNQLDTNNLLNFSDLGLRAAGGGAQAGTNYGAQASDLLTGQGNANASGVVGAGNANAGLYNNLIGQFTLAQLLRQGGQGQYAY